MRSSNNKKIKLLTIMLVVVLIAAIGSASLITGAIWSDEDAVHIRSDEIESSTLIIGSHLIHLSALTQPLYDIASESAGASGQDSMYYKSELADGTWFDINSASSLADITSEGTPVSDSIVEALFMTHHTKSDGVTYDLRTNTPVNIFDLNDPYDIMSMDELLPLKNQWKIITDSEGDTDISDRMKEILTDDCSDSETAQRDSELSSLQDYLDALSENEGGSAEISVVQSVMESVDAQRRVRVLNTLSTKLDVYMSELSAAAEKSEEEDEEEEESASTTSPSTLMSLAAECIQNVDSSIIEYEGKILTDIGTVYQHFKIQYSNSLIAHAGEANHALCDVDVANLIYLDNILNDVISSRAAELELLSATILPEATTRYTDSLRAGENAEYKAELANQSASVLLNSVISANTSTINSKRNELEFMITAYTTRVSAQEGIDFVDERINLTKTFYTMPPYDAFSDSALGTVDDHMEFLTNLKANLLKALGNSEMDDLLTDKSKLQQDLRSALDKNDLDGAKKLEDQISAIDEKIGKLEDQSAAELNNLLNTVSNLENQLSDAETSGNTGLADNLKNQLADAKADLSTLQAGLSDGSLAKEIAALRKDGLDILDTDGRLSDSDMDRLGNCIDALEGYLDLAPKLAFPALKDLHNAMSLKDALDGTNDFDALLGQIDDAILNSKDAYDSAMTDEKSARDLQEISDEFFSSGGGGGSTADGSGLGGSGGSGGSGTSGGSGGSGLSDLTRSELMNAYSADIFAMALQQYYDETGSDEALNLMVSLAQSQRNLGSLTIYNRINSTVGEYIPLSAIANYSQMRYVEKKSGIGTLARGAEYYSFSLYSDAVTRGKDSKSVDYMPQAAANLGGLHIFEDYSYDTFGVNCVYLSGCSYAVICSDQLQTLVDDLFALFLA